MGADDQVDVARRQRGEDFRALAPALAAGEDGKPDARGRGERSDGGKMLARQNLRRRHDDRLAAGLDHGRGGQQRDQRLARANIAVQQPQHAVGLRQVGDDVGDGAVLRRRQRVGERGDDLRAQAPLGGAAAASSLALMAAQERQRELTGEQFVIGKPRPGRALRLEVFGRLRMMDPAQGRGEVRKIIAPDPCGVLPFRQIRHAIESDLDRLAHLVWMQTLGERIDRVDQRQLGEAGRIHDAVGMQHLQVAVVKRRDSGNVAQFADGEQLLQIVLARIEIGDGQRVGVVAGLDVVRRARAIGRRRAMFVHGDRDGDDHARLDGGHLRPIAPVDETRRHVK